MKKSYPTSRKVYGSGNSWARHLKKEGKRQANKSTRKILNDIEID
jgi:hypothetical protein